MPDVVTTPAQHIVWIRPSKGFLRLNLRDLWVYRELLYFLAWRDIKVRYKQTAIGALWVILQPVMMMLVFSLLFSHLAKSPSSRIPYPLFVYAGLLPWQLFAFTLSESANSMVSNQSLITKVYFPRLVVPISSVIAGLVEFGISFLILLAMMLYYGIAPTAAVVLLPVVALLAIMASLSVGLWLSALNVKYRDVRYTIPFLTQLWLFATPVAYPSSLVPERWRGLYSLNPMAGTVEGFRWALLGTADSLGPSTFVSVVMVLLLLISGLYYFRRSEAMFADLM
jgi:lipopolysaccharide transport system permease protein